MQDVKIELISTQEVDGTSEQIEMALEGTMELSDTAATLRYSETDDEGSIFHTVITVDHATRRVEMHKAGSAESHMTIEKGKRHHNIYHMGPCDFNLGVYGEQVDCRLHPSGGHLNMRYTLDINGTYASRNTVKLFVKR